jgi:hypothetical protein
MKLTQFSLLIIIIIILLINACGTKKENIEHNHDSTSIPSVIQTDTIKKSIPKEEHAQIGGSHIIVKYHAPAVRGRTIWGGLVPYKEVWVTGAHSATTFEIDKNFMVGDKVIAAGKYALFTIPDKEKWTIIINKNWEQHLADEYNQKDDVARMLVPIEPQNLVQERLKYLIIPETDSKGVISIRWEKLKVSMPFHIK